MTSASRQVLLDAFQAQLGYTFRDPSLLVQALTHPSWSNEFDEPHNQRLEFLGDAILEAIITRHLFERFPTSSDGDLSAQKHRLVSGEVLAEIGRDLGLSALLRVGSGARKKAVNQNPAMLEDATEALIGALCLDGGFDRAAVIVLPWFQPFIAPKDRVQRKADDAKNAITKLHETCARKPVRSRALSVEVRRSGTPHEPIFEVGWWCGGEMLATGWGTSKRSAERNAAQPALDRLRVLIEEGWRPDRKACAPDSLPSEPKT